MSYTYLQEQGEASSAECFSDIPAFVLSRLNLTAAKSCCNDNATASYPSSQSGMTCEHSRVSHGADSLTLCAAGSYVRTPAPPGQTTTSTASSAELMVRALDFGRKWRGLLAKSNLHLSLPKTCQISAISDLDRFSKTLPVWGMTAGGVVWECATSERTIIEPDCGCLPTPTKHNAKEGNYPAEHKRNTKCLAAWIGGKINPEWNEWRMGWPTKWTDLKPLAMDKFRQWLALHGRY